MYYLFWLGVSLNAIIGENGIITNAQLAKVETDFSGYKEELGTNLVTSISDGKIEKEEEVTLLGENVKKYIPSLKEEDIGKFGVVSGKLYYMNDDKLGIEASKKQKIEVMGENVTVQEFTKEVEKLAIDGIVKNSNEEERKNIEMQGGEKLITKNIENANIWKIVVETVDGKVTNKYQSGWYYVPSGTKIEGIGEVVNPYLINFEKRGSEKF